MPEDDSPSQPTHVCGDCQTDLVVEDQPEADLRLPFGIILASVIGLAVHWFAFVLLLLVGLTRLTIALAAGRRSCPRCGSRRVIPCDTPAGRRLMADR